MEKIIKNHLEKYFNTKKSYSIRFPFFRFAFVFLRRFRTRIMNLKYNISKSKGNYKKYINVRHQSVLMRKLGVSDIKLQKNKVKNISIAIKKLDGIIINPGEVFSFWELVGKPSYRKGYLDGIVINHGGVSSGVGGGLCQLSNLLYWMFLHLNVKIIERHRHSYDIFPDSGRVLPFASGATVFYNYIDLKVKNTLNYPIQIKLWTDEKYLKGQILSDKTREDKYSVYEKFHSFIFSRGEYFRFNIISRKKKKNGKIILDENILENFSPVKYKVDIEKLKENNYKILEI